MAPEVAPPQSETPDQVINRIAEDVTSGNINPDRLILDADFLLQKAGEQGREKVQPFLQEAVRRAPEGVMQVALIDRLMALYQQDQQTHGQAETIRRHIQLGEDLGVEGQEEGKMFLDALRRRYAPQVPEPSPTPAEEQVVPVTPPPSAETPAVTEADTAQAGEFIETIPDQLFQQIIEGKLTVGEIVQLNIPSRIQELMAGYPYKNIEDQLGPFGRQVSGRNRRSIGRYMKEQLDEGASENELTKALPGIAVAAFAEACRRITQRFPEARDQHFTPEQLIEFAQQKIREIAKTKPSLDSRNYSKEEDERIEQDIRSIISMQQLVWYGNVLSDLHIHLKNGKGEFSLMGNYSLTQLHDYDHPIPAEFADWLPGWLESMKTQAEGMTTEQLVDLYNKSPYSLARLLTDGMLTKEQIESLNVSEVFWALGDAKNRQTPTQAGLKSLYHDAIMMRNRHNFLEYSIFFPRADKTLGQWLDQWLKDKQQEGKSITRFQFCQLAVLFLLESFHSLIRVYNQRDIRGGYENYYTMPLYDGDIRREPHVGFENVARTLQAMDIARSIKRDVELNLETGRLALTMVEKTSNS